MREYILKLPFQDEEELASLQSNYLYSRILRLIKAQGINELEILPGKVAYITEEYEISDSDTGIVLGIRCNKDNIICLARLAGDSITEINVGFSKYELLWENILNIIEKEYQTREYELYYSFERNRVILIPKLTEITKEQKSKLFSDILAEDLKWLQFLVTQTELFRKTSSKIVEDAVLKEGYSQLWVSLGELDKFRDEKARLIRKIIENSIDKTNIDPMVSNIVDIVREEINENSITTGNYRMVIGNKTDDLNKEYIHWVMIRDLIGDMIEDTRINEPVEMNTNKDMEDLALFDLDTPEWNINV